MRFPWTTKSEASEDLRTRLLRQEQEEQELLQQPWEQVKGSAFAPTYCHNKALDAETEGDHNSAKEWIDRLLGCTPLDNFYRVMAARIYWRIGEEDDAIAQIATVLAMAPNDHMANREMAKVLVRRGEHEAAKTMLDRAWQTTTKFDWFWGATRTRKERAWYFAPLSGEPEKSNQ